MSENAKGKDSLPLGIFYDDGNEPLGVLSSFTWPEHRLLIAIFMRALRDAVGPAIVHPTDRTNAIAYFYCRDEVYGSFLHFCRVMDLNPLVILEKVESGEATKLLQENTRTGAWK